MEARAIAKGLRVSPIRARLTIDMIRGKSVQEAANILANTTNKSARLIKKVLDSAIANAVNNNNADAATHIGHRDHRTSHIIIVVATKN